MPICCEILWYQSAHITAQGLPYTTQQVSATITYCPTLEGWSKSLKIFNGLNFELVGFPFSKLGTATRYLGALSKRPENRQLVIVREAKPEITVPLIISKSGGDGGATTWIHEKLILRLATIQAKCKNLTLH